MSLHDGEGFVLVAQIVDGHLVAFEREYFHSAERAVGEDGLSVFQGEHRTAVGRPVRRLVLVVSFDLHEHGASVVIEHEVVLLAGHVPVPCAGDFSALYDLSLAMGDEPGALDVSHGQSSGRGSVFVPIVSRSLCGGVVDAEEVGAMAGEAERVDVLFYIVGVSVVIDSVNDDHLIVGTGNDAYVADRAALERGESVLNGEGSPLLDLPKTLVVLIVEEQAASVGIEDKVVLVAFHILVPLLCHPAVLNFFAAAMDALPCSDNSLHRQVRRSPCRNSYADVVIIIVVTT